MDGIRVYSVSEVKTDGIRISSCDDTRKKNPLYLWDDNTDLAGIKEYSTTILKSNFLRKKFHKADIAKITDYRDGIDLYTLASIESLGKNVAVDHIIELQCLSHVAAKKFYSDRTAFDQCQSYLKASANILGNLNITTEQINSSKMNVFRSFIQNLAYREHSIKALMHGTQCGKHQERITSAMIKAYDHILDDKPNRVYFEKNLSVKRNVDAFYEEFDLFFASFKLAQ